MNYKLPCDSCVHAEVCGYKEQMKSIKIECEHPFAKITIKCEKHKQDIQVMPKMI